MAESGSKRLVGCSRCRNHGKFNPVKGHKNHCTFRNCSCAKCDLLFQRKRIHAEQVLLNKKDKMKGSARDCASQYAANVTISNNAQLPKPTVFGFGSSSSSLGIPGLSDMSMFPAVNSTQQPAQQLVYNGGGPRLPMQQLISPPPPYGFSFGNAFNSNGSVVLDQTRPAACYTQQATGTLPTLPGFTRLTSGLMSTPTTSSVTPAPPSYETWLHTNTSTSSCNRSSTLQYYPPAADFPNHQMMSLPPQQAYTGSTHSVLDVTYNPVVWSPPPVTNGVSQAQCHSEDQQQAARNDFARLYPSASAQSQHYVGLLVKLFPEHSKAALHIVLDCCGGDIIKAIEDILACHDFKKQVMDTCQNLQFYSTKEKPHLATDASIPGSPDTECNTATMQKTNYDDCPLSAASPQSSGGSIDITTLPPDDMVLPDEVLEFAVSQNGMTQERDHRDGSDLLDLGNISMLKSESSFGAAGEN